VKIPQQTPNFYWSAAEAADPLLSVTLKIILQLSIPEFIESYVFTKKGWPTKLKLVVNL
jgi:hypothetical protein